MFLTSNTNVVSWLVTLPFFFFCSESQGHNETLSTTYLYLAHMKKKLQVLSAYTVSMFTFQTWGA